MPFLMPPVTDICLRGNRLITRSYRRLAGIAAVSMSIYLFTVSNWSLLVMTVSFLAVSYVLWLSNTSYSKKHLKKWIGSDKHDCTTFNPLHRPWLPQCTASQRDRQTDGQM